MEKSSAIWQVLFRLSVSECLPYPPRTPVQDLRAARAGGHIAVHCSIEGISTNNVMEMRRRESARLAGGVEALEGQGRAREAKTGVDERDEREGSRERLHLGEGISVDRTSWQQKDRGARGSRSMRGSIGVAVPEDYREDTSKRRDPETTHFL